MDFWQTQEMATPIPVIKRDQAGSVTTIYPKQTIRHPFIGSVREPRAPDRYSRDPTVTEVGSIAGKTRLVKYYPLLRWPNHL